MNASPLHRAVRASWPLLGGACGAWLGFGGYFGLAHNADSFGSMLATGFFAVLGVAGLVAGALCAALVGKGTERLLLRCRAGAASALLVATVVVALVVWQVASVVQNRFPGLGSGAAHKASAAVAQ
jgi:multisubunit Na+/H+ antiporter MnhG subunit